MPGRQKIDVRFIERFLKRCSVNEEELLMEEYMLFEKSEMYTTFLTSGVSGVEIICESLNFN
jgi:hypothetical protein